MRRVSELRVGDEAMIPAPGVPWAAALNVTAESDEVAVTLLSLVVVDDLLRLTGLLRVGRRPDVRVATIPSLEVTLPDGTALPLVDARVLPHGKIAWMSWTYERPAIIPDRFEGRISHILLEFPGGRSARIDVPGPWDFSLPVRRPALHEIAAQPPTGMA